MPDRADLTAAEELGYSFGHAFGSVEPELARLAELEAAAADAPELDSLNAALDTFETAIANLPDGDQKQELAGQATAIRLTIASIQQLNDAIDHQRRAVDEANKMPTVLVVSHPDLPTFRLYVDDEDQATVDALADPVAHAERVWQETHPDEMAAAAMVAGKGYEVVRDAGTGTFTVDGEAKTLKQLVAIAETAKPKPTTQQKVAEVLLSAPELGEQTRAALEQALGGPQT